MVDVALGHQMAGVTFALGGFASVTAVQQQHYPAATLVDDAGNSIGQTVPSTTPDHCAFVGILKSGAVASVIMRGGQTSIPGRRQLLWEIDGEVGTIRIEGDGGTHVYSIKLDRS
ncbi:MAG TPA: hypothetical protein VGO47_05665 [Chlamydiales bacterium]|nr:hypothetical protein [Chlamydiales bacterium]